MFIKRNLMNRFLVIGSNSFTGSNFIQALKKNNHFFIGCSRSKKLNYPYLPKSFVKQYRFEKLDLNNDVEAMFNLIKKYNISHIVNFASQSMVAQSWENPIDWYNTNLISIIKLCQKLLKYKKLKKFTQVTTPEVYGSTSKFVKENFNFNPSTPYASSRAACDIYLKNLYDNYNFPIVFTRASNVYGPGQQLYRLIPKAIISFLNKKKFPLQGDGGSKRNFIYIDDVVNATLKVSLKGK
jgi:dTDP-glucose 4,6-dehydratase